jgi:hypothetical protein
MRRLSLRTVVVLTVPAIFSAPAAYAQYESSYGRGDDLPAAIALFSDENFYGDIRDAYDPFGNLHDLAFNDKTRSVAVFAGQWELCEHKNFTGRCVFIKEDVSDLGWFGLAGRVSSVRPIYEYTEAAHGLLFSRDKYGYIRYANNESYGYDTWNYGYASSWGLSVSHYGYSPDYHRYGYYSPTWGYDPYGFAWGPRGTIRYTTTYRRHPRPSVINPYWTGWDWRRSDWRHGHWSWRDGRHGDDWRDWRRGDRDHRDDRDGRGGGGHDWRPGDGDGRGGDGRGDRDDRDDRPVRDVPGDRWGPGAGGTRTVTPIPDDPGPGRDGRGGLGGGDGGSWTPGTGIDTVIVTPPADIPREPRGGREGWGGRGGMPDGLLGGPGTETPRGGGGGVRGRGGDDAGAGGGSDDRRGGSRFGDGMSGGGIFGAGSGRSAPAAVSSPPPPPPPPPSESRWGGDGDDAGWGGRGDSRPDDGGRDGSRRREKD